MTVKGRTTRLILEALRGLSEGWHVVVIAHPAAEAFRIVDEISVHAERMGIPCAVSERNEIDFMSDFPLLYTRPFGWEAMVTRRNDPKPMILIDHSARFERTLHVGDGGRVEAVMPLAGIGTYDRLMLNGARTLSDERLVELKDAVRSSLQTLHTMGLAKFVRDV